MILGVSQISTPLFSIELSNDGRHPVENTVTKNLLKLFADTPAWTTQTFLEHVLDGRASSEIDKPVIESQRTLDSNEQYDEPYLIGISQTGDVDLSGVTPGETGSTIDGYIETADPDLTLGIEVKTGTAELQAEQLVRYADRLGVASTGEDLNSSLRFKTVSWYAIAGITTEITETAAAKGDKLTEYLFREFRQHLVEDHLESRIATYKHENDRKTLRVRQHRLSDGDHEVQLKLEWEGNSTIGWISADKFDQLLGGVSEENRATLAEKLNKPYSVFEGIPQDVREETFGGPQVNPDALFAWAHETYDSLHGDSGNSNLVSTAPDSKGRTFRLHCKIKDYGPQLRLVQYSGTGYVQKAPPALIGPEINGLFNKLSQSVREQAFCGEPDTAFLWDAYLRGEIGITPKPLH